MRSAGLKAVDSWLRVDLCVVPLGVVVSLSPYLATCQRVIQSTGFVHELGPNGTAIEGPWDDVMECVRACHDALHGMGVPRIYTTLKLNTRIDRQPTRWSRLPTTAADSTGMWKARSLSTGS